MRSAATHPAQLRLTRDPLLDTPWWRRAWSVVRRWAPGVAFALAFALALGQIDRWEQQAALAEQERQSANARVDLASLREAHRHRAQAGGCSTLFYLVEGDVGEKLYQATLALDSERGKVLFANTNQRSPK